MKWFLDTFDAQITKIWPIKAIEVLGTAVAAKAIGTPSRVQ